MSEINWDESLDESTLAGLLELASAGQPEIIYGSQPVPTPEAAAEYTRKIESMLGATALQDEENLLATV